MYFASKNSTKLQSNKYFLWKMYGHGHYMHMTNMFQEKQLTLHMPHDSMHIPNQTRHQTFVLHNYTREQATHTHTETNLFPRLRNTPES